MHPGLWRGRCITPLFFIFLLFSTFKYIVHNLFYIHYSTGRLIVRDLVFCLLDIICLGASLAIVLDPECVVHLWSLSFSLSLSICIVFLCRSILPNFSNSLEHISQVNMLKVFRRMRWTEELTALYRINLFGYFRIMCLGIHPSYKHFLLITVTEVLIIDIQSEWTTSTFSLVSLYTH